MPKVSVIIPIYNTEEYLPNCIDSILAQTFTDFELILVNDGSTDNSRKICEEYAKKDARIIVVNKNNEGVTKARERGVDVSRGEWITFIDSDDSIPNNALNLLHSYTNDTADIIIGQIFSQKDNDERINIEHYRSLLISGKLVSPVAKLIRKELFNSTIFDIPKEINIGEDMLMNVKLAFCSQKEVIILKDKIYNYRYRQNSAINTRTRTIEYESKFWKLLKESIPTHLVAQYNNSLFKHVYAQWETFCEYNVKTPKQWEKSDLNKYLRKYLVLNRNSISKINYIQIKHRNIIIRSITILLKKIRNNLLITKS